MKKLSITHITSVGLASILLLSITQPILAVEITPNPTRAAKQEERKQEKVSLKKDKAYAEIDRRITALTALITRINSLKKLSADQKVSLSGQVNTQISSLQTLRTKIEADTDLETLKADKKSIVDSYRIFLLFMPKIRIIAAADEILDIADIMKGMTQDPTALTKINDAITQANSAISTVSTLDPNGYPENKPSLDSARTSVRTARNDLKEARASLKGTKPSPEPTTQP